MVFKSLQIQPNGMFQWQLMVMHWHKMHRYVRDCVALFTTTTHFWIKSAIISLVRYTYSVFSLSYFFLLVLAFFGLNMVPHNVYLACRRHYITLVCIWMSQYFIHVLNMYFIITLLFMLLLLTMVGAWWCCCFFAASPPYTWIIVSLSYV